MKIYFDTCCYCRPFDDQTQDKIRAEAEAVMTALDTCRIIGRSVIGSGAVTSELDAIADANKRTGIKTFFFSVIDEYFTITANEETRADALHTRGPGAMDALHLAIAEAAGAGILLTTDNDFVKIAAILKTTVRVINPLNF